MNWELIVSLWKSIVGAVAAIGIAWAWVQRQYVKYKPIVEPMIKRAEEDYKKAIADGHVDHDERKDFVMGQIAVLEEKGKIKLNGIQRWLISKVVDYIAKKLDPIEMPINAKPKS